MPVVLVLREATAFDRPVREPEPAPPERHPEPVPAAPLRRPEPPSMPVGRPEPPSMPPPLDVPEPGSMLAALGATESDERSFVRRLAALVVLMTLTLATAALIGAGIYRAVAGLD